MSGGVAWAVVPVKRLDQAKRRLAPMLDAAARRALSLAMLDDVLAALTASPGLAGVAVITRDVEARAFSCRGGVRVIEEIGNDLNAAVSQATRALVTEGCRSMMVVPADVPLVTPQEIGQVLNARCGAPGLTLVSDRRGEGTNAFLCTPPDAISPCFGGASFAQHRAVAERARIDVTRLRLPGLGLDVDTPEDLADFLARPGLARRYAAFQAPRPIPARAAGG